MGGLIKVAIERPVAVLALILLTVLFGVVALRNIPIQMSPDIEKPILEVRVGWPGASPEDVDREVVARLESELSGLNGVDELVSSSRRGRATVTLTYSVNQDMDKALVLLLSKLSSVTGLPSDARTPEVRTSNSDDSPIARLALVGKPGEAVDLEGLGNFLETQIVEPLSRVNGVSEVTFNGGGKGNADFYRSGETDPVPDHSDRGDRRAANLVIHDECRQRYRGQAHLCCADRGCQLHAGRCRSYRPAH